MTDLNNIILEHVARCGPQWVDLAERTGKSPTALQKRWSRIRYTDEGKAALRTFEGSQERHTLNIEKSKPKDVFDVLDLPPKTLAVPPPRPVIKTKGKWQTAVLYGDTHYPFQDDKAVAVIHQIIKDVRPDIIVDMGDGVDCYALSKFSHDPMRMGTLQDELDAKRIQLAQFREAAPNAVYEYLEGNHEDRLRKTIWNLKDAAKALARLRIFQRELTWPGLLGLGELHIPYVPAFQQTERQTILGWILKHGTLIRKWSAYTARGEYEKYRKSGASGHSHRLGVFFSRAYPNGAHCWTETGCLCDLAPEYVPDPDWEHGAVVLTFEKDTPGPYQIEPVSIHEGTAIWHKQKLVSW